jgi:hypothetical protein
VVLEEPPHCPFDVNDACLTGVLRDFHQPGWKAAVLQPVRCPSATGRTTILSDKINTAAGLALASPETKTEDTPRAGQRRRAEEMDQDGSDVGGLSDRVYPAGWATKTRAQKQRYWQKRRKQHGSFRPGMAPVVTNHRELSAGDDDGRRLPGH